jgi:hypothetical protein
MAPKRLKQLAVGGAASAALALASPAVSGAAAASTGSSAATPTLNALAAAPAGVVASTSGALNHARDDRIGDPQLTDHELYVRHHQRLASLG